jgi:hypothetical protein
LASIQGYQYCELLREQRQYDEVARRATETIRIALKKKFLLDIALNHLSLGNLDEAVAGLRAAGILEHLILGLLARGTQEDLEHVRIIAETCGMLLNLTDYHLLQATHHQEREHFGEARKHYETAKALIDQTGYHRRDSDLNRLADKLIL